MKYFLCTCFEPSFNKSFEREIWQKKTPEKEMILNSKRHPDFCVYLANKSCVRTASVL